MIRSICLVRSVPPISFFIRGDKSLKFLCVLGVLLTLSYLINAAPAFDDIYLPNKFSALLAQYGYLKTIGILLSGMDLANEYRTYGLSRVLQFFLWSAGGDRSLLFPLFIAVSQVGTAIALLQLARERGVGEQISLAVAAIWLISPFSVTWCFHHYSYQILPFQIVVVTCLVLGRVSTAPYRYYLAVLLGFTCALSGEMNFLTGPLALLIIGISSKNKARLLTSYVAIGAMMVTLYVHHWFWSEFFQDTIHPQRFQLNIDLGIGVLLMRTIATLVSIPKSGLGQLHDILSSGIVWGIPIGFLTSWVYWSITNGFLIERESCKSTLCRHSLLSALTVVLVFLGLTFASLLLYFVVSILTGQVSEIMPRRYGYVGLTLLSIAFVIGISIVNEALFSSKRLALAVFIGLVATIAAQLHLKAIPNARVADVSLVKKMNEAGLKTRSGADKGVLFFVSSNAQYLGTDANAGTIGPLMNTTSGRELFESPFSTYWVAQHYSANMLGFRFAAMPKSNISTNTIEVGGSPHPNDPGRVEQQEVIVVANLGFELEDPLGRNVKVFKDFAEFQPYFFLREINRDTLELEISNIDEFVIDMGLVQKDAQNNTEVMPDKKFTQSIGKINKKWIENYGLLSGQDLISTHPNISDTLEYYRTNRYGLFTYGVSFRDAGMFEVSLDFWEQWGHLPGERVFELEVTWDGNSWASIGKIDIVGLNKNKPVSIVLTKSGSKVFQFRMKPVAGSKDIPVIQGLRIRKL